MMKLGAGLVITLGLLPMALQSQEVRLRLGGTQGQFNRYESTMETWIRGGPMAQMMSDTSLPMSRMTTWSTRTLTTVSGDTLTFSEVIDSARSENPAMPQMAAMAGQMAAALRGMTTTMRMSPRGRIYGVQVGGGAAPAGPGGPGRGGRGMGGGGNARPTYGFPERAVRVGESWTDSSVVDESGVATNTLATYRLERLENRGSTRVAVISMNGTMASRMQQGSSTMSVTGEIKLDVTNSRLAELRLEMNGTMTGPRGDTPMKMVMQQRLI